MSSVKGLKQQDGNFIMLWIFMLKLKTVVYLA